MSRFWELPDRSVTINLDMVPIVRRDSDGSVKIYILEWEHAIDIKREWADAFFAALMARP